MHLNRWLYVDGGFFNKIYRKTWKLTAKQKDKNGQITYAILQVLPFLGRLSFKTTQPIG